MKDQRFCGSGIDNEIVRMTTFWHQTFWLRGFGKRRPWRRAVIKSRFYLRKAVFYQFKFYLRKHHFHQQNIYSVTIPCINPASFSVNFHQYNIHLEIIPCILFKRESSVNFSKKYYFSSNQLLLWQEFFHLPSF